MPELSANPPRIGLDASSIVSHRAGIGHATHHLLTALAACWPEGWPPARVWINAPPDPVPLHAPLPGLQGVQVRRTAIASWLLNQGWHYLNWPPLERWTGPLSLAHAPAGYLIPARCGRRILTVHDLFHKHQEINGGDSSIWGAYHGRSLDRQVDQVSHFIVPSVFLHDELARIYGVEDERITVIPYGVAPELFHSRPQADDMTHVSALGLERPYLLCVATIEPRKNLVTLIEAYARARHILRAGRQQLPRLVVTGQPVWGMQALEARLSEAGLRDLVTLTGYVNDTALAALYRQALGLVCPSIYEGFGMAALEAMACGCPVAMARSSSLPEVGGEAVLYFNPMDSDAMARALSRFIAEPHLRGDLRQAGLLRSQNFRWEVTARATLNVYRRVLGLPLA